MKNYIFIILFALAGVINLPAQCENCASKDKCEQVAEKSNSDDGEFEPYNSDKENSSSAAAAEDEFETYTEDNGDDANAKPAATEETSISQHALFFPILSLIATALAGVLVRFRQYRFRGLFLVTSLVTLGFYVGACPCPISSLANLVIGIFGGEADFSTMIWFLSLLPLTYVFGRVWCGWVCHLGALQEFLYRPTSHLKFLASAKSQKVMKYLRYILFVVLIIQLAATKSYLWGGIDPFRMAFNLDFSASAIEWSLLILLLLTSLFSYRPFCKSACPIGLVLGWINKIPGAARLVPGAECKNCGQCIKNCPSRAVTPGNDHPTISAEDCFYCGECDHACKLQGIRISHSTTKAN